MRLLADDERGLRLPRVRLGLRRRRLRRRRGALSIPPAVEGPQLTLDALHGPLTAAERDAFEREGAAVFRGAWSAEEVAALAAAFGALAARARGMTETDLRDGALFVLSRGALIRVVGCASVAPALARTGTERRLVEAVAQLIGRGGIAHVVNQAELALPTLPPAPEGGAAGAFVEAVTAIDPMSEAAGTVGLTEDGPGLTLAPGDVLLLRPGAVRRVFPAPPGSAPPRTLINGYARR